MRNTRDRKGTQMICPFCGAAGGGVRFDAKGWRRKCTKCKKSTGEGRWKVARRDDKER